VFFHVNFHAEGFVSTPDDERNFVVCWRLRAEVAKIFEGIDRES
jgi:hypothetical protein